MDKVYLNFQFRVFSKGAWFVPVFNEYVPAFSIEEAAELFVNAGGFNESGIYMFRLREVGSDKWTDASVKVKVSRKVTLEKANDQ